jgi:hypothetical protein
MSTATLTFKAQSLYIAFAPQFGVSAYGGCQDEALNNLTDELRERGESADKTKPSYSR